MYAAKCVEFDSSGEMWSLYEETRTAFCRGLTKVIWLKLAITGTRRYPTGMKIRHTIAILRMNLPFTGAARKAVTRYTADRGDA